MVKPLPEWFSRAQAMKVWEVIVVDVKVEAVKQRVIINNLAKLRPARFKTKRLADLSGYKIERVS